MRWQIFLISFGLGVSAIPALAQINLPQIRMPPAGTVFDPVAGDVLDRLELDGVDASLVRKARRLADQRERRLKQLVKRNSAYLEFDTEDAPARRGELLVIDATAADLAAAQTIGFVHAATEEIEGLDLAVARLVVPPSMSLADAQKALSIALPDASVSADNLYFHSGRGSGKAVATAPSVDVTDTPVGIIDGAPGKAIPVLQTRGFAKGAPHPADHGSAIASLLRYAGGRTIRVADVYGTDPAGGNALAIAKALGWLVDSGSEVVNISLVGPRNALVARAISAAQKQGVVIVAAVGNDGPAAPPSYPASYNGVIAVTAVDKRNRALIEAGRALHLDYAAPGADIFAPDAHGKRARLRGTSFASPLVTARIAAALERSGTWQSRLDDEARDLGKKGPDTTFGRGLICGECRPQ